MKIVRVNKEGWLGGIHCTDATIEVEVSDEIYVKLLQVPFAKNWRYINNEFILQNLLDDTSLKIRRQKECFDIVDNRSPMWYNHLTSEQKAELDAWYQAWLDVTETHIIPVKPEWLK